MGLFVAFALLGLSSWITAGVLSLRLRRSDPELHKGLGITAWLRTPDFWVYRFVSAKKRSNLGKLDRALALGAISLLTLWLMSLVAFVLYLARYGNL